MRSFLHGAFPRPQIDIHAQTHLGTWLSAGVRNMAAEREAADTLHTNGNGHVCLVPLGHWQLPPIHCVLPC